MKPTLIATKTFTSQIVREHSCTSVTDKLGEHSSTMELYKREDGSLFIEWDVPELDEGASMEIELDGMDVVGYDGIFELPEQAIELLKEQGYNTEEVE